MTCRAAAGCVLCALSFKDSNGVHHDAGHDVTSCVCAGRARRRRSQSKPYWMGTAAVVEEAAGLDGGAASEQGLATDEAGENSDSAAYISTAPVQPPDDTNQRKQRRKSMAPRVQDAAAPEVEAVQATAAPKGAAEHPVAQAANLPTAVQQPVAADSMAAAATEQPQVTYLVLCDWLKPDGISMIAGGHF